MSEKDKGYYINLERGYEGEVKFDELIEDLKEEHYIINDLLLEVNHSLFQIDSVIISQRMINLVDVKNFQGDYYLDSDNLYTVLTKREYKNPVIQLKRSHSLFRQLLQSLRLHYLIDATIIFINPEFTLYQAPIDQPLILPTQVNKFIKNLNETPSQLNDGHKQLAQKLMTLHLPKNPYSSLPKYNYEQLRKGILCKKCLLNSITVDGNKCICQECGFVEPLTSAVLRSVDEFKLLFPDKKITTTNIFDWCKVVSKERIGKILRANFNIVGSHQWAYYE
ncbi:nuclease-related domain-containing protein [Pullulanibacillus sp. KACC 23026]|uniref:nuclease-related domain-containing protein n=1 Tax=Pullulanibacillus sp. KACC 23026 TaxID=3028315 RepID=UPI0031B64BCC